MSSFWEKPHFLLRSHSPSEYLTFGFLALWVWPSELGWAGHCLHNSLMLMAPVLHHLCVQWACDQHPIHHVRPVPLHKHLCIAHSPGGLTEPVLSSAGLCPASSPQGSTYPPEQHSSLRGGMAGWRWDGWLGVGEGLGRLCWKGTTLQRNLLFHKLIFPEPSIFILYWSNFPTSIIRPPSCRKTFPRF